MLTVSSSSITSTTRRPKLRHRQRRHSPASPADLFRPRTITIEKSTPSSSFGFSIQTYGFASINPSSSDVSASSLLSLSSGSTASRKSSASYSGSSASQTHPIQLVTYVDHVRERGPAWEAGLRSGSIILSVDDQTVENDDHETLVKRITSSSMLQLKLVVIQQNINRQIALCEQLQVLYKQLHEKEEELQELSKQEMRYEEARSTEEVNSPSPRLQQISNERPKRSSSFCHDKIPLDWRQSVANFVHQQKLTTRTLAPILNSTSIIIPAKYVKNPQSNLFTQRHQRSMSLSTIVLHCSKSSLFRGHQTSTSQNLGSSRRAFSYEELFSVKNSTTVDNNQLANHQKDDSVLVSGCSLAVDLSQSFNRKNCSNSSSTSLSSSSSSSTTINIDKDDSNKHETIEKKIKQFKWKLRINK